MANKYGIIIGQPGQDALTTEPTEEVFDSEFDAMAIAKTDIIDKTGDSGATLTFTIKHGMPFVPAFLIFYKSSFYPDKWQMAPGQGISPGIAAFVSPGALSGDADQVNTTDMRVDKENLVVRVNLQNGLNDTISLRYFIFNTPIALSL